MCLVSLKSCPKIWAKGSYKQKKNLLYPLAEVASQNPLIKFILHLCTHRLYIILFLITKTYVILYLAHKIQEKCLSKANVHGENATKRLSIECEKGHKHNNNLCHVAFIIFNINAKNYASEMKENLCRSKNNKDKYEQSKSARKITILKRN